MTWMGWLRNGPGEVWEAVVQHEDPMAAHRLLLAEADRRKIRESSCRFLTQGGQLDERRVERDGY
jgi:hypothetical protein